MKCYYCVDNVEYPHMEFNCVKGIYSMIYVVCSPCYKKHINFQWPSLFNFDKERYKMKICDVCEMHCERWKTNEMVWTFTWRVAYDESYKSFCCWNCWDIVAGTMVFDYEKHFKSEKVL